MADRRREHELGEAHRELECFLQGEDYVYRPFDPTRFWVMDDGDTLCPPRGGSVMASTRR